MFSLQKFFGKDPKFFDLLEGMADQAVESADALLGAMERGDTQATAVHNIRLARRKSKELHEEISELVVRTFVTSLEREDIEGLSNALYKIPKPAEKFLERYFITNHLVNGVDFADQIKVISQAANYVREMIILMRKGINLEKAKLVNQKLQQCEASADELEINLLKELFRDSVSNPLKIYVVKDLYDLLERAIDRCRDAGSIVVHTVLKNS